MKPSRILSFLLAASCLLFIVSPARAEVSIVVSPPRYDSTVDPGETIQKTIKVTNNSDDNSLTLTAKVIDFIVQDDSGTPVKVSESASGRYLASPWFYLDREELTLAPHETGQIVALVTVPSDALPGGHYAGVFFEPTVGKNPAGTASQLAAQVGSLFGITVNGKINFDAFIKNFTAGNRLYEYGPINFSATIENQSDTHIRPKSKITVKDMLGRTLTQTALDEVNIFPYTSRTLEGSWDTTWGLGRYTATLTVAYGPGLTAERTLYFWILPYRILAAIIVVLLALLATIISLRRHLAYRTDTRDEEIDSLKQRIAELENKQ